MKKPTANKNCCCNWGAAIAGEWPEFQCFFCEIHTEPIMASGPDDHCRRHTKDANAFWAAEDATWD